ncbi:hypothetical protein F2Q70_00017695 [Brassica cretica]|uniref:Uncharacterized protein n=1 Tax=Brassica cretica TaxID=69181 RepID=A0A3N6RGY1_BRACR|nr:hypothetical protein F2Q70_00017695 [Brassica cretica]KAF2600196.1 hypothetical protein F2Q68_00010638 [Brassica cretica]
MGDLPTLTVIHASIMHAATSPFGVSNTERSLRLNISIEISISLFHTFIDGLSTVQTYRLMSSSLCYFCFPQFVGLQISLQLPTIRYLCIWIALVVSIDIDRLLVLLDLNHISKIGTPFSPTFMSLYFR